MRIVARTSSNLDVEQMGTQSIGWLQLPVLGLLATILLVGGCTSNSTPETSATTPPDASSSMAPSTSGTQGTKININTAPIAELDKLELPGTKPSLSERIQGGRPYKSTDDLVSKKVISEDEYKLIQGLVTTGQ